MLTITQTAYQMATRYGAEYAKKKLTGITRMGRSSYLVADLLIKMRPYKHAESILRHSVVDGQFHIDASEVVIADFAALVATMPHAQKRAVECERAFTKSLSSVSGMHIFFPYLPALLSKLLLWGPITRYVILGGSPIDNWDEVVPPLALCNCTYMAKAAA